MPYRTRRVLSQVVAIHRHVKGANRNAHGLYVIHHGREPMGQRHSSGGDPHQHQALGTSVRFQDLVSYPRTGPGNLFRIHHDPGDLRSDRGAGPAITALGLWRAGT
jgi:hypothetical protein